MLGHFAPPQAIAAVEVRTWQKDQRSGMKPRRASPWACAVLAKQNADDGNFPGARRVFSFAVRAGVQQEEAVMRVLVSGIAAAIVLGVIAAAILSVVQKPAYDVYSSSSTRVGDPGSNLVGRTWTDNSREAGAASGSAGAEGGTGRSTY
jgi:hypothetical protein